jgi:hypothetical protein
MKAYLVTAGTLFALIAVLDIWRIIAEWNGLDAGFWFVAGVGALALALSAWARRLFAASGSR